MPSLLEANGLTKHYGSVIALDGINLNIGKGITGLLGPNGAGKSTAIKLFLGLIKPTAGSAQVLGAQPYESVEIRARLGYMPEHDCLPSLLAASEFLTHMAQVSGLPPAYARVRGGGHPPARRSGRGEVPGNRRVLHRHEAKGQARASAGA